MAAKIEIEGHDLQHMVSDVVITSIDTVNDRKALLSLQDDLISFNSSVNFNTQTALSVFPDINRLSNELS